MILRARQAHANGLNYSNPFLERAKLGAYNEVVVAVGKDDVLAAGFVDGKVHLDRGMAASDRTAATLGAKLAALSNRFAGDVGTFEFNYIGKTSDLDRSAFSSNPLNLPLRGQEATVAQRFNRVVNNSHTYAQSILRLVRHRY
jgi:hypothetical protein